MSKKNTKIDVKIPKYDSQAQLSFIVDVSKTFDFEPQTLLSLILADWICNFQEVSSIQGSYKAFVSYLQSCEKTSSKLSQLREVINEQSK